MKKLPKDHDDPAYTGYFVNCSPGFAVAALGMMLMACGLAFMTFQRSYSLLIPGIVLVSVLAWVLIKLTNAPPFLQSIWFVPHVTSYFTGYAFVLLAGISAFISMKMAQKFAAGAFLFLTFGLCLGSIWASEAWGAWWSWDPKENLALTQWLMLAAFIHMPEPWRLSVRGAVLLVSVLLLSAFMYFGMHLLPTAEASLHVYG
jgi:ABC-type transport system involved in cytochrome c biogenesis permease subunit